MPEFRKWDPVEFPGCGHESLERRQDGLSVYRSWIERRWSDTPPFILWVMFNPSVATIESDGKDKATPLCFQRSRRIAQERILEVGAMRIVNLFSRRSTDTVADCWPKHDDLDDVEWIGPDNDLHICCQSSAASLVVAGWGAASTKEKGAQRRADFVEANLVDPWCLNVPGNSHPYYAGRATVAGAKTGIVRLKDARQ